MSVKHKLSKASVIGVAAIAGLALAGCESESEKLRKAALTDCFSKVTSDFTRFDERRLEVTNSHSIKVTTVSTKENGENIRYLPKSGEVYQEKYPDKRGSLNADEERIQKAIFVGPLPPRKFYQLIEPTEEQRQNLAGFRTCLGLEKAVPKPLAP